MTGGDYIGVQGRGQFAMVPAAFLESDAPSTARLVFVSLASFMGGERRAYPSVDTISKRAGVKRSQVFSGLKWLVENGWLIRERGEGPNGTSAYSDDPAWVRERERLNGPSARPESRTNDGTPPSGIPDTTRPESRTTPVRNPGHKQTREQNKEQNPPYIPPQDAGSVEVATVDRPEAPEARIRQVFDHWLARRLDYALDERQPRLTPPRRAAINARLHDGYTVAELCDAIDGVLDSDWHRTHGHTDLTAIMRPRKVDAHITRATDRRAQENRRAQGWADAGAAMDRVMSMVNAERERTR